VWPTSFLAYSRKPSESEWLCKSHFAGSGLDCASKLFR
jgi:hypothetical protein